jgi:cyclophilin family peptidyl-prolyl cis-trans isomerase/HEAT repeat protein
MAAFFTAATAQQPRANGSVSAIPTNVLLPIMRAEDERRWDNDLAVLLADKNAQVRKRVALAMGRIGDERALPALLDVLKTESENDVRQMIAFAIGEIESPAGAAALIEILDDTRAPAEIRARAVEALGKIGGALLSSAPARSDQATTPKVEDERLTRIRTAIIDALKFEAGRRSMSDRETILLGLTAVLRTRPEGAGPVVVHFLKYSDSRIVADALNTMARLRLKDGSEQVRQLLGSGDAVVRANAARVAGAAEDKQAFDALLARALYDYDVRVRVSAIRALGSLKDARAADPLRERGEALMGSHGRSLVSELLEITVVLGRLLPNKLDERGLAFLRAMHGLTKGEAPEVQIAFARIAPGVFQSEFYQSQVRTKNVSWRRVSARVQGLAAIQAVITGAAAGSAGDKVRKDSEEELRAILNRPPPSSAVPEVLRAYASYKPSDLKSILLKHLGSRNQVLSRATAAELLGDLPLEDKDIKALADEFLLEITPSEFLEEPDAAIAILDTLGKQKSPRASDEIKKGFLAEHYVIRRRAAEILRQNGVGDFSKEVGFADTRLNGSAYRRAIARIGKHVTATLVTSKGSFVIEFLPEDAPLTVDNFVQLARKGYFNGITFHRVVPNFVIQGGDPRGDGSGGPGYSIRCEINEAPYERAAVGMALSGKDTGGSQWFVTHSPQPHLDGGYTVFGRVIRGMEVVDRIARGDIIRRVIVSEKN